MLEFARKMIPDSIYLKVLYYKRTGTKLNLEFPQTFNEKLQWLKLYDRRPEYTIMVDKYAVKDYVAKIIGQNYIIPSLGVWDNFDDINFKILPEQFVLKCTHDSGGLVICKDKKKLDIKATKKIIEKCLKRNYYWPGREWPYKNVKPRIIIEKYIENKAELRDYKFFCFNGKVKCFKIDFNRFVNHRANYFNRDKKLMKFGEVVCPPDYTYNLQIPLNIENMIKIAEILAKDFPFLRVDLYNVNGHIYFGEMTLYPASGFGLFIPKKWDSILGGWLQLPIS